MKDIQVARSQEPSYLSKASAVATAMRELPAEAIIVGYEVDRTADYGSRDYIVDVIYEMPGDVE